MVGCFFQLVYQSSTFRIFNFLHCKQYKNQTKMSQMNPCFERYYCAQTCQQLNKSIESQQVFEESTSIILPPPAKVLLVATKCPTPYILKVTNTTTNISTYARVYEFTSPDSTIAILSTNLIEKLRSPVGFSPKEIHVKYVHMPPATYIAIQPHKASFNQQPNHMKHLKKTLSKSSHLRRNGTIKVTYTYAHTVRTLLSHSFVRSTLKTHPIY